MPQQNQARTNGGPPDAEFSLKAQHLDFGLGSITCEEKLGIEGDCKVVWGVNILDEAMGVSNQAAWDNVLSLLADDGEGGGM